MAQLIIATFPLSFKKFPIKILFISRGKLFGLRTQKINIPISPEKKVTLPAYLPSDLFQFTHYRPV
jgi:hypothetical protein